LAAVVVEMVQLHPYQYVYFNRMSGGLKAAATQYETEYYAHSFKELGEKLSDRLWETERDRYLNGDYRIRGCSIFPYILMEHMPANFSFPNSQQTDFYAGYRRSGCVDRWPDLPLVVAVERQGVLLNVIRDERGPLEARGM
jgi:hypothetical protein